MNEITTTEELVSLLNQGNMELFDLIQGLDASQMEAPGVQGFRSVKDILAHITFWNLDRPLDDVLEEYKEVFEWLLNKAKRLEREHLEREFDYHWAKAPVSGRTIVMWRYWHQQNHTKHIKTWIENQN